MNETLIESLVRENVRKLKPYSSARDEFTDVADVYLDANENPFQNGVNRYPDPLQKKLKRRIGRLKDVDPQNILLGNGSDEVLDLIFRAFCNPEIDNCIYTKPSYGMYSVLAATNAVATKEVLLTKEFGIDYDRLMAQVDEQTKLIFLCSPNNPTGNLLKISTIEKILLNAPCLVVIDEAYIDFTDSPSWTTRLSDYPNLIVCQTLSKAWGMAGLRLGMCFASTFIIQTLNKIKPPYNVNGLTQDKALEILQNEEIFQSNLNVIKEERARLLEKLRSVPTLQHVFVSDANFILAKFERSNEIFDYLMNKSIIIRNRGKDALCEGCLRITVGLPNENNRLIDALMNFQ